MNKTIAFIGAGNMGGALARAACRAVDPMQIVICTLHPENSERLSLELGCLAAPAAAQAATGAEYVMLCVKPQYYAQVLRDLLPVLRENADLGFCQTLVSIVAGVTINSLSSILAEADLKMPIIRMMPNTPAAIGKGVMLVAANDAVSVENSEHFRQLLKFGGMLIPMSEQMLDLSTPISGCGPAFVYMFIDALADGGVQIGIPREQARLLAAQTVLGSASMILESGMHPGELKDAVCSPGGSTIVGVEKLEEHSFRYAVAQAVKAAYDRNCQLG